MKKNLQRFGVRTACALVATIFAAQAAWALDPFKVQDIRVEGLQRVEPGTVFASIPVRVGDEYTDEKGAAAIRSLFGLGLFTDVRLEATGNVLVVVVQERPTMPMWSFRVHVNSTKTRSKRACATWAWPMAARLTRRWPTARSRNSNAST